MIKAIRPLLTWRNVVIATALLAGATVGTIAAYRARNN